MQRRHRGEAAAAVIPVAAPTTARTAPPISAPRATRRTTSEGSDTSAPQRVVASPRSDSDVGDGCNRLPTSPLTPRSCGGAVGDAVGAAVTSARTKTVVEDTLYWVTVAQVAVQHLADGKTGGNVERVLSELLIHPADVLFSVDDGCFSHS
ncbi:hypothetical protein NESM_000187900 [Novymonas esmeraldas]|uniref:Uncharacterized protein n=1 Tax=Novymonas esmeraldas TaxID=1808958 RepID=A0AAW0F695_9TRYP